MTSTQACIPTNCINGPFDRPVNLFHRPRTIDLKFIVSLREVQELLTVQKLPIGCFHATLHVLSRSLEVLDTDRDIPPSVVFLLACTMELLLRRATEKQYAVRSLNLLR